MSNTCHSFGSTIGWQPMSTTTIEFKLILNGLSNITTKKTKTQTLIIKIIIVNDINKNIKYLFEMLLF